MNGFERRIAGAAGDMVNALNPLRLFQREQGSKLATRFVGQERAARQLTATRSAYRGAKRSMLSDWWAGHDSGVVGNVLSLGKDPDKVLTRPGYLATKQRNMIYRRAAVGALGAATIGAAVAGPNLVSDTASAGLTGASVLGLAGAAFASKNTGARVLGYGLLGGSAYNVAHSGDNWGPF